MFVTRGIRHCLKVQRTFQTSAVHNGFDRFFPETDPTRRAKRMKLAMQDYDVSLRGIRNAILKRLRRNQMEALAFDETTIERFGNDYAALKYFTDNGAAVKLWGNNEWYHVGNKDKLPPMDDNTLDTVKVEALILDELPVNYDSFAYIALLDRLAFLSCRNCPNVDVWCINRLQAIGDSLFLLDVSGCPMVKDYSLVSLHHLKGLKRLVLHDLPLVTNNKLFMTMLEEAIPNCYIETSPESSTSPVGIESPIATERSDSQQTP